MTWIWTDHGNLDTVPQLQLEDGKSLHVTAGPEVEMETLLLIAAAPELLVACKTLIRFCSDRHGQSTTYQEWLECFMEDGSTLAECVGKASVALEKAEGAFTR